jgi:hypothetical protein
MDHETQGAPMADGPIVTDWIQAGASIVSVGVAIWATTLGIRAKRTGERVEKSGREAVAWAVSAGNEDVNARLRAEGKTVWQISRDNDHTYSFTNTGSQEVKLLGAEDVTRPGEQPDVMLLPGYEGVFISPGNAFRVNYERSLASPAVARVEVTWEEGARTVTQVYAVS